MLTVQSSSRESTLRSLDRLPRLSPLFLRLVGLVAQTESTVSEVADVVERDALLSAQILERANSAAFSRVQPIHSVRHAVAMLGVGVIRRFALGASLASVFRNHRIPPGFSFGRFNLHTVAAGTLAEMLAEEMRLPRPDSAFAAGLLHDIGKLLIAGHMPAVYENVLGIQFVSGRPILQCERELLGADHAEISAMAISRWDLEASIVHAARYHHEPELAPEGDRVLARVVHTADAFVNYLGMSVLPPRGPQTESPPLDIQGFNVPVARVTERFQGEIATLKNLLR